MDIWTATFDSINRTVVEPRPGVGGEHGGAGDATVALGGRNAPVLRARRDRRRLRQHERRDRRLSPLRPPEGSRRTCSGGFLMSRRGAKPHVDAPPAPGDAISFMYQEKGGGRSSRNAVIVRTQATSMMASHSMSSPLVRSRGASRGWRGPACSNPRTPRTQPSRPDQTYLTVEPLTPCRPGRGPWSQSRSRRRRPSRLTCREGRAVCVEAGTSARSSAGRRIGDEKLATASGRRKASGDVDGVSKRGELHVLGRADRPDVGSARVHAHANRDPWRDAAVARGAQKIERGLDRPTCVGSASKRGDEDANDLIADELVHDAFMTDEHVRGSDGENLSNSVRNSLGRIDSARPVEPRMSAKNSVHSISAPSRWV